MLSWGTQCCQESTTVSVVGRVTNNHVTIDAQDANGKRRYNSAVLYRKQSGRHRPGLVITSTTQGLIEECITSGR